MEYYYLAASLPPLQVGVPPEVTSHELKAMFQMNLSQSDLAKVTSFLLLFDLENLRNIWLGRGVDERGNYNEDELEERMLTRIGFPEYVFDFLDGYDSTKKRLQAYPALLASYFEGESRESVGVFHQLLTFEREWRLVLTGFRARQTGRDLVYELQFEDPSDECVAQILAQKDAKSYEPPTRYSELKAIFEEHKKAPLDLFKALCVFRFHKIETLYGVATFSVGRILAYLARLMICEEWLALDKAEGLAKIETIIEER